MAGATGDGELDLGLVDSYIAGTLDARGQAVLAEQLARVIPFHWAAPNPIQAAFSRLAGHLGGQSELLTWLDRFDGRPRVVARLYEVIGLLDTLSDNPAIVSALRDYRARVPYPPGLVGYLVPDTNEETLAGLGGQIERLLTEDETDEAVTVAVGVLDMLEHIAPAAEPHDRSLINLARDVERVRERLVGAAVRS